MKNKLLIAVLAVGAVTGSDTYGANLSLSYKSDRRYYKSGQTVARAKSE